MLLRFFRDATAIALGTAYRYVHEGIDVIADQAPDIHQVIADAQEQGLEHLLIDGTLIATDRVNEPHRSADRWYSGKHKRYGSNVQVISISHGWPLWTSPVEPGSAHDLTCARTQAFPALYPVAVRGLPVLADKGYTASSAGIRVPVHRQRGGRELDEATLRWNAYINAHRAPVERAIAVLKVCWRALKHVTLDPARIDALVATALVLTHTEKTY